MAQKLWSINHPGILLDGDAAFLAAAAHDLNLIRGNERSGEIGELLKLISKRCQGVGAGRTSTGAIAEKRIIIKQAASIDATQAMPSGDDDYAKNGPAAANFKVHGSFLESEVFYIPGADAEYTALLGLTTPPYIALAHELLHALHSLSGDLRKQYDAGAADGGLLHEEARTVGLGIYKNTRISENAFRRRDGLRERTYYSAVGDTDNLTGLT